MKDSNKVMPLVVVGFASLIILIAFIFSMMRVSDMQNPTVYVLSVLTVTAFAIWALVKLWNEMQADTKLKHLLYVFLVLVLWFVVTLGVASSVKSNRDACIPSEELLHSNGYIPNPDAYLAFHTQCPENETLFDAETVAYIRANHRTPSWIVRDGYTDDAVGWAKAHGFTGADVSNVAIEIADNNGKIPEKYLK